MNLRRSLGLVLLLGCSNVLASGPQCISESEVAEQLALDPRTFDQDSELGWRRFPDTCSREVAELIVRYINRHAAELTEFRVLLLRWHAGQSFAFAGDYAAATQLMEQCRQHGDHYFSMSWNLYVEGTLAFLAGDIETLGRKASDLRELIHAPTTDKQVLAQPEWAKFANLRVLEGLVACANQPYAKAYGCRPSSS